MASGLSRNVLLLGVGFGVGQGALFLVQTGLIWRGEVAFIGLYGLCFSLLVLAQQIVDWGGLVVLAREELAREELENPDGNARFWSLCWVRLALAVAGLLVFLMVAPGRVDPFSYPYILCAWPGLALFAFNAGGLLDGHRMSGANGLASAIPYLTTALALTLVGRLDPMAMAVLLGGAFSVGLAAQCGVQHVLLRRTQARLGRPVWEPALSRQLAVRGGLFLITWLPSQLLVRIQILLAMLFFGPAGGGLLLYAKQILNVGLQGLFFIRRAQFPSLVAYLRERRSLSDILVFHKYLFALALLGSLAMAVLGLAGQRLPFGRFAEAGLLLVAFAPVPIVSCFYSSFNHIAFARGAYASASIAGAVLLPVGTVCYWLSAQLSNLALFALTESLVALLGTLLVWWFAEAKGRIINHRAARSAVPAPLQHSPQAQHRG